MGEGLECTGRRKFNLSHFKNIYFTNCVIIIHNYTDVLIISVIMFIMLIYLEKELFTVL